MINYWAVLVAAIVAFLVGWLWHGPLFKKQWTRLMGWSPEKAKQMMESTSAQKMVWSMVAAFIANLVTAGVVAWLTISLNIIGVTEIFQLTFWLWLGFNVTLLINGSLWEGKSWTLYLFNIVYQFVYILIIALIVGLWH